MSLPSKERLVKIAIRHSAKTLDTVCVEKEYILR